MTIQLAIFATMLLVQGALAWRLSTTTRALDRVHSRLSNQSEALSLLTDTSENGFSAIARELGRLAAPDVKPTRRASTRRVASAARKGQSVTDIAAAEQVSEGEVRLRMHLAAQAATEMSSARS